MKKFLKINILFLSLFFMSFNSYSFASPSVLQSSNNVDYSVLFAGNDPWERFNRKIYCFNAKLNKYILRPVNIVWASIMPQYGMDRIKSAYTNALYPKRLVSSLIEKDFKASKQETKRFFINTTIGVAGLYDPAKTKYKLEPRDEDMGQAFTHCKFKKGPYLVLPIVAQGNLVDVFGTLFDYALNPTVYITGPIAAAASGLNFVNDTGYMQPIAKTVNETYADPYDTAKKLYTIERYIKNSNLDRTEIYEQCLKSEQTLDVANLSETVSKNSLKADVILDKYNPQSRATDAMRTMYFDNQILGKSPWSDLSLWNKTFPNKIKTSSVNIYPHRKPYKFRYVLQPDKTAPLAILYPSIGEGVMSTESVVFAKILYDKGYSVVIQGSPFQWEFVNSMPKDYRPGFPAEDAMQLRLVTAQIIDKLEDKKAYNFKKKVLVGCSFGGITGLFVANQERQSNLSGISKYLIINPPIELFYALNQLDSFSTIQKQAPDTIKQDTALMAEKIIKVSQIAPQQAQKNVVEPLPFSDSQAKAAIDFAMRQKLSDVIYSIENKRQPTKKEIYKKISEMTFSDYAQEYIVSPRNATLDSTAYQSSLYVVSDFLQSSDNYKIYHTLDDCFASPSQLQWLKQQTKDKSIIFSNGSHLGSLYRKEFYEQFRKDISF